MSRQHGAALRRAASALCVIAVLGESGAAVAQTADPIDVVVDEWRTLAQNSAPASVAAEPVKKHSPFSHDEVRKAQTSLTAKGFEPGPADGVMGPRTRAAIRSFQESERLQVTGRLDQPTAASLGVEAEPVGGNFKSAGRETAAGGKEFASEMKDGKPVAAGKELGKGIGRAAKKVGAGVVDAVNPDSDRGDREERPKEQKK